MDPVKLQSVLNLAPGQKTEFLGLSWHFLAPNEQPPRDILFTPTILCDGKIDAKYIAKAYKSCDFKIVVSCTRDEVLSKRPPKDPSIPFMQYAKIPPQKYSHKNLSGVIGIIFAKRHLDGVYINLTCASTYKGGKIIQTKLGLILRTTMLNFIRTNLGVRNVYNHAANQDLVGYYKRLGWVLTNQICGVDDDVSIAFRQIKDDVTLKTFLASHDVELIKTAHGYPMRICDFNIENTIANMYVDLKRVETTIVGLLAENSGSLCLPRADFSGYLKNVYDESDNEYNSEYDITNYENDPE